MGPGTHRVGDERNSNLFIPEIDPVTPYIDIASSHSHWYVRHALLASRYSYGFHRESSSCLSITTMSERYMYLSDRFGERSGDCKNGAESLRGGGGKTGTSKARVAYACNGCSDVHFICIC